MADEVSLLRGSCACERNQYQIELPIASTALASVFFDNSAQSRRPQASPVTAWLRIPLDFYHSFTIAQFADETHASIRRTYTTALSPSTIRTTRRQFCGYCGTHLTAFDESQLGTAELIDVTLGSLLDESLDRLQTLKIFSDSEDVEESRDEQPDGRVIGGSIDEDTHISGAALQEHENTGIPSGGTLPEVRTSISRYMQHRGMPYFEEMIENSSLGRIRRQKGGHRTEDGRTTVLWEIVEVGDDETMQDSEATLAGSPAKKVKLDS
ncbi:hypothetical protein AMS68_002957 [Peltaster fructicola]|uniref:CENP-V/GFA domain-containing protein n=1 Tax=Peltaster fructicola TaxID=286661 RepID=A0A6H0XSJ4_9PEZI|nr:hypothetical protein AMS68_002957 [Peltaster fructicola]